ncbi:unnamed protein product [Rotaria sordida]|uniref:Alpha-1,3-glucosyltransferase n=1 Tax=Rotaria sordida TaxID=392033 RepID=A0A818GFZ0_9BILA|nr:unnamed protein product [Rotaria sordida]CAF1086449.1 unnamed protein product [Rotaria sordida]CAF3491130.1 unnamed protein product [Rotaria sordida]CAF3666106.1 unnamed protein product [Rotaria sordida]
MDYLLFLGLLSSAIAMRWIVARYPYSGYNKPPMFGDFEAQRHWMEVTINLPINEWYQNSSLNNLTYWGLDYPLLTAYHSYICGWISNKINPIWCALKESHGHESSSHKLFMRYTVFIADLLIYYPAAFYVYRSDLLNKNVATKKFTVLLTNLFYPLLILIDHGHFQYNSISLGLALIAFVMATQKNLILVSAILFTLSLNYKQMELYHAIPIFVYLLSAYCFEERKIKLKTFLSLGLVVIVTFFIIWIPVLRHDPLAVIKRLFPFDRGLYEDKVANFWCTINLIVKLRSKFNHGTLAKLCLLTTSLSILPSCFMLFRRPTVRNFYISLFNVSLCFYLFSFQVHEKTILLPCLPLILLSATYPVECFAFLQFAMISVFPLMIKDNLVFIFWITFMGFSILALQRLYIHLNQISLIQLCFSILCITITFPLLIAAIYIQPPIHYPDLWIVLISACSCIYFLIILIQFHIYQFKETTYKPLQIKKTN